MTPLDLVVNKLRAAGCNPSPTGPDAYESRCPAHDGKRKNLSVGLGDDGRVLLHCHHAGDNGSPSCRADAIVGALGLRLEDLFPPKSNGPVFEKVTTALGASDSHQGFKTRASGSKTSGASWKTLDAALSWGRSKFKAVTVTSWTYHDAHGNVVMVVGRFDDGNGEKTYRPFHRLPDGSWAMSDPPGLLPLYRLPEIVVEDGISICEGEKCGDALDSIDYLATTSSHGSESPHKTDWTPLAGKDVAILPDNDPPGEGYAAALLRIFKRLDPRPRVRIIRLPGLGDGEDVADWLPRVKAGRSGEDPIEHARIEYERLWNEASSWTWTRSRTPLPKPHGLWVPAQR
jgi:putative DNA primase/helicase